MKISASSVVLGLAGAGIGGLISPHIFTIILGVVIGIVISIFLDPDPNAKDPIEEEKKYFAHLDLNGTNTAQEKDDYNRLHKKYGEYMIKRPKEMSHVDREKYERMYRQDRKNEAEARKGISLDNSEKMIAWRKKYSNQAIEEANEFNKPKK